MQAMAKELGMCARTAKNNIQKLTERNWLGFNPQSGYYFVRGFNKIREIEGLKGNRGVCLSVTKELNHKSKFRAFIAGAAIGNIAKKKKWQARCAQESEHLMGSSNHHSGKHLLPSHYPIACQYLVKVFGISLRTASLYKKWAAKYGFIDVKKNLQKIILGSEEAHLEGTVLEGKGINAAYAAIYKKSHPDIAHRVRRKKVKGKWLLFLENTDTVQPCIEFTKRHRPAKK